MTHNLTDAQLVDQTVEYLWSIPHRAGKNIFDTFNGYETFYCKYRSGDEAAPTCAAGKWIEDEFYSPDLEDKSVGCDAVTKALLSSGIKESQLPILESFQVIHDNHKNWDEQGLSSRGKEQLHGLVSTLKKKSKVN